MFKEDNLTFSRETISMINIRIMDVTGLGLGNQYFCPSGSGRKDMCM